MSLVTDPQSGSGRFRTASSSRPCLTCGFELWIPLASLEASEVGLYNDERFPGRLLVSLRDHYDHFDDVPNDVATALLGDVRFCSWVLRRELGAGRVNFAILGNQESHVHAHLIPRRASDAMPRSAPWQDPRPRKPMSDAQHEEVVGCLADAFGTSNLKNRSA